MNKEEQKYLIALGNLQNMAIDNTKGSKAVEICANDIRTYVERLNNIIDELEKWLDEESEKTILSTGHLTCLMMCKNKLNELKGEIK